MWDLKQLTSNESNSTLDKPKWLIPMEKSINAPVQVRINGDVVAVNHVDNSVQVFKLKANGASVKLSSAPGEVAQAWRFEIDS